MVDIGILKKLVPINELSEQNLQRLAQRLVLESMPEGEAICRQGDTDNDSIFLVKGSVELESEGSTMKHIIQAGSQEALFPIAPSRPRQFTVTTISEAEILRMDSGSLDRAVVLDEITTTIRSMQSKKTIKSGNDSDWFEKMLASEAFNKLPQDEATKLVQKLEPVPVKRGDILIKQSDRGDYYYIIQKGRINISRKSDDGKVRILAELRDGDVFGEESLITGQTRNASVVAMSDGIVLRLPKSDFLALLKIPLLQYVSFDEAQQLASNGSGIIDVRTPEEFRQGAIEGSINLPMTQLRQNLDQLDNRRRYVVCCNNGIQSEVAAFLLRQRGFDVAVLQGGLQAAQK